MSEKTIVSRNKMIKKIMGKLYLNFCLIKVWRVITFYHYIPEDRNLEKFAQIKGLQQSIYIMVPITTCDKNKNFAIEPKLKLGRKKEKRDQNSTNKLFSLMGRSPLILSCCIYEEEFKLVNKFLSLKNVSLCIS